MSYEDIVGQQFDIMGNGAEGGPWGCPPGVPVSSLGQVGYPLGGCLPYGYPAPCGPGYNGNGNGNGYGPPPPMPMGPMVPAGNGGAVDAMGGGYGGWGGGYGGGYGGFGPYGLNCFGPPVAPHLIQQVAETATFLRPRCPTRIRTEWVGFPRTCIRACETVKIECDAQELMKIIKIVIPSNVAFDLIVEDIKIGKECLVNCHGVPGAMFIEDAADNFNTMTETLQIGTTFSITLTNVSGEDICVSVGALARIAVR